jgi:hypothetical protein
MEKWNRIANSTLINKNMAIPSRQIGWSTQSNLLWTISKELERLTCVMAGGCTTTTTTTTVAPTTSSTTTV